MPVRIRVKDFSLLIYMSKQIALLLCFSHNAVEFWRLEGAVPVLKVPSGKRTIFPLSLFSVAKKCVIMDVSDTGGNAMEPIYVTGHRNPDTDSIVSAMAYAQLRTALGDREYVASRLGRISDDTQLVLDRFGFEPPVLIHDLRTQVSDLNYDTPPALNKAATVDRAW